MISFSPIDLVLTLDKILSATYIAPLFSFMLTFSKLNTNRSCKIDVLLVSRLSDGSIFL